MKYSSKHKYNKDGSINPRYKYRVRYLGISSDTKVKKFRHKRTVKKQGYKYKGKIRNIIMNLPNRKGVQIVKSVEDLLASFGFDLSK